MLPKKPHWIIYRHSFLFIGIITLCLLLVVSLARTGEIGTTNALPTPLRILVVPMYLAWMLWSLIQVAILGPVGLPQPWVSLLSGIGLIVGLAPYALADYILARIFHNRISEKPSELA